jgi:hypothetical protein
MIQKRLKRERRQALSTKSRHPVKEVANVS